MLLYTNDALVVSKNSESMLRNEIYKCFEIKKNLVRPPKTFLGSSTRKIELENGIEAWALRFNQYFKAAV